MIQPIKILEHQNLNLIVALYLQKKTSIKKFKTIRGRSVVRCAPDYLKNKFVIGFYGRTWYQTWNWSYKTTKSNFCLPSLSLPVSVTKYVSPRFIANCASLSIKIICIKNTIPGLIINGFPVKIIGGTSIQFGAKVDPNEYPQAFILESL